MVQLFVRVFELQRNLFLLCLISLHSPDADQTAVENDADQVG